MIFSPQSGFGVIRQMSWYPISSRVEKILAYLGLLRGEEQKRGPPTPPKKSFWKQLLNFSMMARILGDQLSSIGPHDIRLLRNTVAKIR
jgi:hypothetical protein